jgi:hypothetical protein
MGFEEDRVYIDWTGSYVVVRTYVPLEGTVVRTGAPLVQRFFDKLALHGWNQGLLLATPGFTDAARRFATDRDIRLVGYLDLAPFLIEWDRTSTEPVVDTSHHF